MFLVIKLYFSVWTQKTNEASLCFCFCLASFFPMVMVEFCLTVISLFLVLKMLLSLLSNWKRVINYLLVTPVFCRLDVFLGAP